MIMLKVYDPLRNAPSTDARKNVHAVVSNGSQHVLIYSFYQLQVGMHFITALKMAIRAEYVPYLLLVQYGNCVDCCPQKQYVLLYTKH